MFIHSANISLGTPKCTHNKALYNNTYLCHDERFNKEQVLLPALERYRLYLKFAQTTETQLALIIYLIHAR